MFKINMYTLILHEICTHCDIYILYPAQYTAVEYICMFYNKYAIL